VAHFEVCLDDLTKTVAGDWLDAAVAAANRGMPGLVSKPLAQALAKRADANIIVAAALERYARRVAPPTVFFHTDAVVSGFADHFSSKHGTLLRDLMEINARRNLALHARTRVDATYLATVPGTTHKVGDKLQIDTTYLTDALRCLRAIVTCAYGTVAQLYGGVMRGYFRSTYGSVH
jgi:hypothetical protein